MTIPWRDPRAAPLVGVRGQRPRPHRPASLDHDQSWDTRSGRGLGVGTRGPWRAEPRPERLGLVMKYSWAETGLRPGGRRRQAASDPSCQDCMLSLRFTTMIWSSTWAWTVGLWMGTRVSTRQSRLRAIQSALEM